MRANAGNALIVGAQVTVITIQRAVLAGTAFAGINGAKVTVFTVNRITHTGAVEAVIVSAGIRIIANNCRKIAASAGEATVKRASIIIITIRIERAAAGVSVAAGAIDAGVSGAWITVINCAYRIEYAIS